MTQPTANSRGYNYRWQTASKTFLKRNPLCKFCTEDGVVKAAELVDHIKPHRGDQSLFWDTKNWQALCKLCHDSTKARIERGLTKQIGLDGWPIDDETPP